MTRVLLGEDGQRRQVIFEVEPDSECEFCHAVAELRPYGPNRERICYECGMKDEEATRTVFLRDILGSE